MEGNNFGDMYNIFASILCLVGGVVLIFFRKKILSAQLRYLTKRKDFMNRKIGEELARPYAPYLAVFVGLGLITVSVIQLLKYF